MRDLKTVDRFPALDGPELWATGAGELPGIDTPLEGLAVSYRDEPNFYGRIIVPGAFKDSLRSRPSKRKPLVMGYEHSTFGGTNPIGGWRAAKDDPDAGIQLSEGHISNTAAGRDVATLVADGHITGLSIGFITQGARFGAAGETHEFKTPYGTRSYELPADGEGAVFITKGELLETSIVSTPADDEGRLVKHSFAAEAVKALPGLEQEADWDDVAYSMALLQGGRGAAAFSDLPELERVVLYQRLVAGYERFGKSPPPYDPDPKFREVPFAHDEREQFAQRFTAKRLADVASGLEGLEAGPLSREGCAMLMRVARAALPHLPGTLSPEAAELARDFWQELEPRLPPTEDAITQSLRETLEILRS